jgi:hypothetical protein
MVQTSFQSSDDARGNKTVVRFEPDLKGRDDAPPTPTLIVDTVFTATDVVTAQQIYGEQVNAGVPEAKAGVNSIGGMDLPALGDEWQGQGGCGPCDSGDLHFRIVFRYLNVVHVLYTWGQSDYASQGIAVNYAQILADRVKAVPSASTGPVADEMKSVFPRQVALTVGELGKQINTALDREGSDDRSSWVEGKFKRPPETVTARLGPLLIYDKVWVANSVDQAWEIYSAQAQPGFPEAEGDVGTDFAMENMPGFGNETFGWTACNETCNTEKFNRLHQRLVWRNGNVVVVLYMWGRDDASTVNFIGYVAGQMNKRIN